MVKIFYEQNVELRLWDAGISIFRNINDIMRKLIKISSTICSTVRTKQKNKRKGEKGINHGQHYNITKSTKESQVLIELLYSVCHGEGKSFSIWQRKGTNKIIRASHLLLISGQHHPCASVTGYRLMSLISISWNLYLQFTKKSDNNLKIVPICPWAWATQLRINFSAI